MDELDNSLLTLLFITFYTYSIVLVMSNYTIHLSSVTMVTPKHRMSVRED